MAKTINIFMSIIMNVTEFRKVLNQNSITATLHLFDTVLVREW
jgi:hypothetical protein